MAASKPARCIQETKPGEAPSVETLDKLANLDLTEPDATTSCSRRFVRFSGKLVRSMFDYYNNVTSFFREVQLHAALTKNDRDVLAKCIKAGARSCCQGQPPLGVTFDYSQKLPQTIPGHARRRGLPEEGETSCDPGEMKLRYRTSMSGQFRKKPAKVCQGHCDPDPADRAAPERRRR